MKYLYLGLLLLSCAFAHAQYTVNGTIYNATDGSTVPFVNIIVVDTQVGTTSDTDGKFTINMPAGTTLLKFQALGFATQTMNIAGSTDGLEVTLQESTTSLDEVVVTALGIEKERQALVSAVSTVGPEKLTTVSQTNLVNSLAGQVAGVQITNGSSGVGSSSRIIIRGENSLSGSNQPLFVVDGVPISNEQITSDLVNNGALQEVDYGNGSSEFSPDDIESISIFA